MGSDNGATEAIGHYLNFWWLRLLKHISITLPEWVKPIMLKNVFNFRITVYQKLLKKLFSDGTVCVVKAVVVVVVEVVVVVVCG